MRLPVHCTCVSSRPIGRPLLKAEGLVGPPGKNLCWPSASNSSDLAASGEPVGRASGCARAPLGAAGGSHSAKRKNTPRKLEGSAGCRRRCRRLGRLSKWCQLPISPSGLPLALLRRRQLQRAELVARRTCKNELVVVDGIQFALRTSSRTALCAQCVCRLAKSAPHRPPYFKPRCRF